MLVRGGDGKRILIVDHGPIAELLQQLLQIRGYSAQVAQKIEEAALMVRILPPDLLILDPLFEGGAALQFVKEFKSNPLTELIPVIMGSKGDHTRVEAIQAGADVVLEKPILAEEFIATIHTQLKRKEAIDRRISQSPGNSPDREFDAFISHASEDKDEFVRPLAQRLASLGIRIWFDEQELRVGDSLRETIERGLAHSKYGIVVLSGHFFAKHWPQRELNGLMARENGGKKVILPVWFNLSFEEVEKVAPMLADRIAARSQDGLDVVVERLVRVIRPATFTAR
jgi:DNA-binding response OmpR family regulator